MSGAAWITGWSRSRVLAAPRTPGLGSMLDPDVRQPGNAIWHITLHVGAHGLDLGQRTKRNRVDLIQHVLLHPGEGLLTALQRRQAVHHSPIFQHLWVILAGLWHVNRTRLHEELHRGERTEGWLGAPTGVEEIPAGIRFQRHLYRGRPVHHLELRIY